jgi:hypothetical protein
MGEYNRYFKIKFLDIKRKSLKITILKQSLDAIEERISELNIV